MYKYFINILTAIDQLCNSILNGYSDETLSARSYRRYRDGKSIVSKIPMKIINTIFFFQSNHCFKAYLSEKERLHLAPEYRGNND